MTNSNEEAVYLADLRDLTAKAWPRVISRSAYYPFGEIPLTEYLRKWAVRQPEKPAIIFYGQNLSFGELDRLSDRFAQLLASLGVVSGDRVAVYLPNCPQFLIAFYGILKLGAVHVPVNPLYKEHEFLHQINDAGAEIIVVLDQLVDVVRACRHKTQLHELIVTSLGEVIPTHPTLPLPPSITREREIFPDTIDMLPVLNTFSGPALNSRVSLDDIAALNYTGGTTGTPKGCVHTQRDMIYTAATTCGCAEPMGPADVSICFNPVFWIAGEDWGVIFPIFSGATCVLLYRWDPLAFMSAVNHYKVTHNGGSVDLMVEVMEHASLGDYDLRSLKSTRVVSFVKSLSVEHRKRWFALTGTVMIEATYGSTETHTMDTFTRGMQESDFDLLSRPTFVGLPVPGTELKICDFESHALKPLGAEGEICIRSPSLLKGYWRKPEESSASLIDGWFHSGDIGLLDEHGYLHFLGRYKEMLKVKGMSVFPTELEGIIAQHPAVACVGVIGVDDPEKGQSPMAFVTLDSAWISRITEAELVQWCRSNMAPYKVPAIRFVDALPMTATGKVQRAKLSVLVRQAVQGPLSA
jgi:acyl-CoA synthetase (AMP-forming)/AMP-acid ligase II